MKGDRPVRQVWAATRPAIADQPPVRAMLEHLDDAARHFVTDGG